MKHFCVLCSDFLTRYIMTQKTRNSYLFVLILVGVLAAFGPFVTDFYLPALPELATYFDTTASVGSVDFQWG